MSNKEYQQKSFMYHYFGTFGTGRYSLTKTQYHALSLTKRLFKV